MLCSHRRRCSLASRRPELGGGAVDVDSKLVVRSLVHSTCVDELAQQILCRLVGLVLPLQRQHLLLELLDHCKLGFDVRLPLGCSLLVGLDLCKRSSSLGRDLEHICRDALRDC